MNLKSSICLSFALFVCFAQAQVDSALYSNMKWREIGPFRGGRSDAVSGVPGHPDEFYMGTCGGGLFKSTNAGKDWKCVSDGFFKTGSVGNIAVSSSNTDVVYVGMGEAEPRGNITHGDGVYKSVDGGSTWTHQGLEDTHTISKVRIDPKNPDIVYVGALGHVYGPNRERGVYKSTDGGKSWDQVLYVSDKAGCTDLIIDPTDSNTLYASIWEMFRTPYALSSGGADSGLYKSTDAGKSWKKISGNKGFPSGLLGKICLAASPAKANRVWANVEVEGKEKGLYLSDDGGESWTRASDNVNLNQRAFYFNRIFADPKNPDKVHCLNVQAMTSENGGKTWRTWVAGHVDNHDMWIDPEKPERVIVGNDGGAAVTINGGTQWSDQDYATAQFYHVSADNAFPYHLLGCQQDNSSIRILSRTFGAGITTADWTESAGGESGYLVASPLNPDVVFGGNYGGYFERRDHKWGTSRMINVWPENITGGGVEDVMHRFQWTFPIVFSPHNPKVMYSCSQHVLMSKDEGGTWVEISPDLTTNDKSKQLSTGGPITKDNTGVEVYCTVFTLAESPKKKGVLWAGSDDGLVHITTNSGKSWKNVTPATMPKWGLCSMIEASPFDPATAYLAVDNHENNDFKPYLFITHDFGKSWTLSVDGFKGTFLRSVREDPVTKGLLYAGTESGVYASFDAGMHWQPLQMNLPIVPIHDLVVKGNDLCVATHGRSFWILDNISPLREMATLDSKKLHLFKPVDATMMNFGFSPPPDQAVGKNPQSGVIIDFYAPAKTEDAVLEMFYSDGKVIATQKIDIEAPGITRVSLSPRYDLSAAPAATPQQPGRGRGGFGGSLRVPPGTYKVRVKAGAETAETMVRYLRDPRLPITDADLFAQFDFGKKVQAKVDAVNTKVDKLRSMKEKITTATKDKPELAARAKPVMDQIAKLQDAFVTSGAGGSQDFVSTKPKLLSKLQGVGGNVRGSQFGPTSGSYQVFDYLVKKIDPLLAEIDKLEAGDYKMFMDSIKS